jgi:hypothetical protein
MSFSRLSSFPLFLPLCRPFIGLELLMGKQRRTGHNSFSRASIDDPFDRSCVAIAILAYRGQ